MRLQRISFNHSDTPPKIGRILDRTSRLTRIVAVCGRAMANSRDANRAIRVDHLVDDAVGANSKGPKPLQSATKQMSDLRFALEQAERFRHGIDQRPIETQQLAAGAPGEHDSRHWLTRPEFVQLSTKLIESDDIALRQLCQAKLEGGHRIRVRENLCGLLERLVLVDGNERCCGPAIPRNQNVVPPIGHLAQHLTEMGAELTRWNCPGCHW